MSSFWGSQGERTYLPPQFLDNTCWYPQADTSKEKRDDMILISHSLLEWGQLLPFGEGLR